MSISTSTTTKEAPELFLRPAGFNDTDRAIVGDVFNSCITWLNAEKDTPEQWGDEPWSKDQIAEKADKHIKLGLSVVEMVPPDETAQERVPVAIYGTGPRMPYVPADPEREEEKDMAKELYLMVMIVHRKFKGFSIGERLIQMAKEEAREKGKEWLRVDCYGGVEKDGVLRDGLARYYQRNGFVAVRPFTVRIEARKIDWPGLLLEQRV
jgi:GNAT superfamily N-acetyltransferase